MTPIKLAFLRTNYVGRNKSVDRTRAVNVAELVRQLVKHAQIRVRKKKLNIETIRLTIITLQN